MKQLVKIEASVIPAFRYTLKDAARRLGVCKETGDAEMLQHAANDLGPVFK